MSARIITAVLMTGLFLSLFCMSCTRAGKVSSIDALEAFGQLRNDFAVLLDLREDNARSDGMAEPARSMPLSRLKEEAKSLPRDKMIIVYGDSAAMAKQGAELLSAEGYRVGTLESFEQWKAAKLPVRAMQAGKP